MHDASCIIMQRIDNRMGFNQKDFSFKGYNNTNNKKEVNSKGIKYGP